ncbi:MAG: ABC transporter substrate-binding protein [Crenarchaeota archaeon]|nr:ABC transporter substrate-binding protein [Thermoproteota archaeon]
MAQAKYLGLIVAVILVAAAAALLLTHHPAQPAQTTTTSMQHVKTIHVPVGVLVDLSGPTSGVGRDYAKGVEAGLKYFNEKGVYTRDGVRVVFDYWVRDYAYNPTRAETFYKEFRDKYGVWAIIGWGTADTEQLADSAARDHIAYFSASYSAKLVVKPYNFFPAPDYSTQACAAMKWIASRTRNARLVLLYDHNVAYSRSPIPAIKAYAPRLGIKIVGDVHLPLRATEADAEKAMREAMTKNPDYYWCGNTIRSCALAVKAAAKLGAKGMFVINVWGFDERFPKLAGRGAYGRAAGVSPFRYPEMAEDTPGYKVLTAAMKAAGYTRKDIGSMLRFEQGFLNVWLLVQAIERLNSTTLLKGKGEAIKEALESSCHGKPFTFGGLAPPARYCPGRHLPYTSVWIILLGKDGKLHAEGPINVTGFDCVKATLQSSGG